MTTDAQQVRDVAVRSIMIMAAAPRDEFDSVFAPTAVNHEDTVEPPACRTRGPAGFHAAASWLREAFEDLHYEVNHVVADAGQVAVDVTMSGRHTGDFVLYDERGLVDRAYAPTGKKFAVRQTHWFRIADGLVVEHWAHRDDLGQGLQLGWVPPTPVYLIHCARAARRARRS